MDDENGSGSAIEPTPWVRYGRVQLQGHQDLGLCRVEFDRAVGLFGAVTLTTEEPELTWFPRGSLYALTEVTEAQALKESQSAAASVAKARARREAERSENEALLARVRAEARDVRLVFHPGGAVTLTWSGELEPGHVARAVRVAASYGEYGSAVCFQTAEPGRLHVDWVPSDQRPALVAWVREMGGTVEGEDYFGGSTRRQGADDDAPF